MELGACSVHSTHRPGIAVPPGTVHPQTTVKSKLYLVTPFLFLINFKFQDICYQIVYYCLFILVVCTSSYLIVQTERLVLFFLQPQPLFTEKDSLQFSRLATRGTITSACVRSQAKPPLPFAFAFFLVDCHFLTFFFTLVVIFFVDCHSTQALSSSAPPTRWTLSQLRVPVELLSADDSNNSYLPGRGDTMIRKVVHPW